MSETRHPMTVRELAEFAPSACRVTHGPNDSYFPNLVGKTVASVRRGLASVFSIHISLGHGVHRLRGARAPAAPGTGGAHGLPAAPASAQREARVLLPADRGAEPWPLPGAFRPPPPARLGFLGQRDRVHDPVAVRKDD